MHSLTHQIMKHHLTDLKYTKVVSLKSGAGGVNYMNAYEVWTINSENEISFGLNGFPLTASDPCRRKALACKCQCIGSRNGPPQKAGKHSQHLPNSHFELQPLLNSKTRSPQKAHGENFKLKITFILV